MVSLKNQNQKQKRAKNHIRIIGGKWRNRKIVFPDTKELRPTPVRIRETLFNWLMPLIRGSNCLDLFAGSGILSFEALSRGASNVIAVDSDKVCCQYIQKNKDLLQALELKIINQDVFTYISNKLSIQANIIFIDPPYALQCLKLVFQALEINNIIATNGMIYFEHNQPIKPEDLPVNWKLLKQKKAGKVYYYLAHKD